MSLRVTPYIMLDGTAKEAIEFYVHALNAEVVFKQTVGEGPADPAHPLSAEEKNRIAHAVLRIGQSEIMITDTIPGQSLSEGNKVNICITADKAAESTRIYEALQQGGQVDIPLESTYFSPAYALVTDKYGVTFQIFTARPR